MTMSYTTDRINAFKKVMDEFRTNTIVPLDESGFVTRTEEEYRYHIKQGLDSMTRAEAKDFFGRSTLIFSDDQIAPCLELWDRITEQRIRAAIPGLEARALTVRDKLEPYLEYIDSLQESAEEPKISKQSASRQKTIIREALDKIKMPERLA